MGLLKDSNLQKCYGHIRLLWHRYLMVLLFFGYMVLIFILLTMALLRVEPIVGTVLGPVSELISLNIELQALEKVVIETSKGGSSPLVKILFVGILAILLIYKLKPEFLCGQSDITPQGNVDATNLDSSGIENSSSLDSTGTYLSNFIEPGSSLQHRQIIRELIDDVTTLDLAFAILMGRIVNPGSLSPDQIKVIVDTKKADWAAFMEHSQDGLINLVATWDHDINLYLMSVRSNDPV